MSAFLFSLFLIALYTVSVGNGYFPFSQLETSCLLLFLVLACLLFAVLSRKKDSPSPRPIFIGSALLGAYFIWGAMGFFYSVRPEASLEFSVKYIAGTLLLFFLHLHIKTMDQLNRLCWLLSCIAAVYIVLSWIMQPLFPLLPVTSKFIFLNTNFFANYLLFPLATCAALYLTESHPAKQKLAWGLFVLVWAQVGMVSSRGGFVAAVVMMALFTAGLLFLKKRRQAVLLFYGAGAGWLVYLGVHELMVTLNGTIPANPGLSLTGAGNTLFYRQQFWHGAFNNFLQYPWTGSGPWTFDLMFPLQEVPPLVIAIPESTRIVPAAHAHSLFFQTLSDTGLIGVGLLLSAFLLFFIRLYRTFRSGHNTTSLYALCLIIGMTGYLTHNLIEYCWPSPYFIYTVVLWFGMAQVVTESAAPSTGSNKWWTGLGTLFFCIGVWVLVVVYSYEQTLTGIRSVEKSLDERFQLINDAKQLCPTCDFPHLHQAFLFGQEFERTGNPIWRKQADASLDRALALAPFNPEAVFTRGLLLEINGNYTQAMRHYLKYYRTGRQLNRFFEALDRIKRRKRP